MWPWEHAAVGYIAYSLAARTLYRRPPTFPEFVAVLVGSQFPDLIDKPAGGVLGVFPSGVSVAHSVFVAVPVSLLVIAVTYRYGRGRAGVAFSVGYLLHLPGDALYRTVTRGLPPDYRVFLWPIVQDVPDPSGRFLVNVQQFFRNYRQILLNPEHLNFLAFEAALLVFALVLWVVDGSPGAAAVRERLSVA